MVDQELVGKSSNLSDIEGVNICARNTTRKRKKSEIKPDIRKNLKQFEYKNSEESSEMPSKVRSEDLLSKTDKEEIETRLEDAKKERDDFQKEMKEVIQSNKEDKQAEFEKMRSKMGSDQVTFAEEMKN